MLVRFCVSGLQKLCWQKKLILHGQVPHSEVPKWLKVMDFLIFPYSPLNEHLIYYMSPIKIAEYMASGIPIITSDLPAVKEILPNDMAIYSEIFIGDI